MELRYYRCEVAVHGDAADELYRIAQREKCSLDAVASSILDKAIRAQSDAETAVKSGALPRLRHKVYIAESRIRDLREDEEFVREIVSVTLRDIFRRKTSLWPVIDECIREISREVIHGWLMKSPLVKASRVKRSAERPGEGSDKGDEELVRDIVIDLLKETFRGAESCSSRDWVSEDHCMPLRKNISSRMREIARKVFEEMFWDPGNEAPHPPTAMPGKPQRLAVSGTDATGGGETQRYASTLCPGDEQTAPPTAWTDPSRAPPIVGLRLAAQETIVHGVNCEKELHVGGEQVHAPGHDGPYFVDGLQYCGRCHCALDH